FGDDTPGFAVETAEETAFVSLVTRRAAVLLDAQENRVAVAVDVNRTHALAIPGGLTLDPEGPAGTAPVRRVASRHRTLEGSAVHVGEHQHRPAGIVLDDD